MGIGVEGVVVVNIAGMLLLGIKVGTIVGRRLCEPGVIHATSTGGAVETRVGILVKTKLGKEVGVMNGCMVGILVGIALGTNHKSNDEIYYIFDFKNENQLPDVVAKLLKEAVSTFSIISTAKLCLLAAFSIPLPWAHVT